MYISSRLSDSEYAVDTDLDSSASPDNICFDDRLHLAVSMRSFSAENVSSFVKSLLDCEKSLRVMLSETLSSLPYCHHTRFGSCKTVDSIARGGQNGLVWWLHRKLSA